MKKIIHIDMDYFFAQVEELDRPELKDKPFAIGGISSSGRGVLSTSNYIARKFGVKSAMPSALALKKCPDLILVRSNFDKYREASHKIFKIFQKYTYKIEKLSLDEAYLDVTECELFNNDAVQIAKEIKAEILRDTKLTASAGVSYNKLLAKIGSDLNKPNGLSVLRPQGIEKLIASFGVNKIWGVGKVTQAKMHSKGIYTFGDLQKYTKKELIDHFGDSGVQYYNFCRGIDEREVSSNGERKSLSVERTFNQDLKNIKELDLKLEHCFEEMKSRLSKYSDRKIKSIVVKIKFFNFNQTTIETSFQGELEFHKFRELLHERLDQQENKMAIRLIGAGVKFYTQSKKKGQLSFSLE